MKQKLLKGLVGLGIALCLTAGAVFAYTPSEPGYDCDYEYEEIIPIGTPPKWPYDNWPD